MRATFLILLCWAALSSVSLAAPKPYHATRERRISFADQPPRIRAGLRRIRAEIYRVVLPDISVHDVSFPDALHLISLGFRKRHPEHFGLSTFFKLPADKPRPIGEPEPPGKPTPLVSLTLHSASTAEALDALCAQGNFVWYVDLYSVSIVPAEEFSLIRRRLTP